MRGAVAKILRGHARAKTVGLPERRYVYSSRYGGTVTLKDCTRETYKQMKRAYKRA